MAGETRIIAFEPVSGDVPEQEFLVAEESRETVVPEPEWETWEEEEEGDAMPAARSGRLAPAIGIVALLAWSGFFAWAMADRVAAGLTPGQWIELIRDWAVPVLLIAVGALVLLRNSRREALRFGEAARVLGQESALLETRLSTVNRELSLAREFIAAQSRDLETLGRLAADKLSTEADRLQGLIRDNHTRVETIGAVSAAALDNMEKLRGQLPVIASSAKDVTNNIGNAGRSAHSQLQEMINGFRRLNEFGQASERQVQVLRGLVDDTMTEFARQADQYGEIATTRFAALYDTGAEFRTQLESHEVQALAAIRTRASAMAEELEETRRSLDGSEAENLTSMRARLSALREEGAAIARALRDGENRALEGWQANVTRMKEELQSAVVALQEAETEAAEATQARIGTIGDELANLERRALDQSARFAADIERRRAETLIAEETATARMRDHFLELDKMAATRRERHGEVEQVAATALHERLAVLDREIAERRARHEQVELAAAEQLRARLTALDDELAQRRLQQEQLESDAAKSLRTRFAVLDSEIAERRAGHEAQGAAIIAQTEAITSRLAAFERQVADVAAHGGAAETSLSASLEALTDRLAASRTALAGTDGDIAALTDSSVRLLELIQASVKHSSEELPQALIQREAQLADIEARMAGLREAARAADVHGAQLAGTIDTANTALRQGYADLSALQADLEQAGSAHGETLARLKQELDAIASQSTHLADDARTRIGGALDELSRSTLAALAGFGESGAAAVSALARKLGDESAAVIETTMRDTAAATAERLERAIGQATNASRDAAVQLRDQLGKVNELTGNLESRVAHARERAEEQVDNDFTRRVALITESLNSNAIDIAKALSTDVADTAWAAYLRGDRGIFTRRAVSLVDNAEAKAIAQIYERDREFHDHVSRYVHDFEAMLRQVLSARDGQALGVTLLSSDMGKLYVALAQAIKRLR